MVSEVGLLWFNAVGIPEDRSMIVPAGKKVVTGYVSIDLLALENKSRMAIGDVERAMQRRMSCAPNQPWPCPVGEWRGDTFWIFDGRHECVAAIMLGCSHILVAWLED